MESCAMCEGFTYEKSLKNVENYKLCGSCYSYYDSDNEFIIEMWPIMWEKMKERKNLTERSNN